MFDYESPITQIVSDMQMEYENHVLKAVQNIGIHVNREELVKALAYDRGQYEKGYADGLNADRWIPCSERLPEEKVDVLICYKDIECDVEETGIAISNYREITFGGRPTGYKNWIAPFSYFHQNYEVIAWQPLPAPYQKGE